MGHTKEDRNRRSWTVLGIDAGPNSIGWALIDEGEGRIVDLGVRIFPEGVDNFDTKKEKSRNEDRRIARGMRRQVARRARRKRILRQALIEANLWPSDPAEQAKLEALDPYELRARAVDPAAPPLSRHELGRAILHINQRRGFLSNRKRDAGDKETQGMLAAISSLAKEMEDEKKTLGRFLHDRGAQFDHERPRDGCRIRNRHTHRQMLADELDAIAKRHPDILTDKLMHGRVGRQDLKPIQPRRRAGELKGLTPLQAFGIRGIIFFQRSLYWPKSMIGLCELEPKQPRCPRADRRAQRFRMLQEVNNLEYIDPDTRQEQKLTAEQRALLLSKLATREKMDFNTIRKALGFLESVKFNLEKGERSNLKGHVTDHRIAAKVGKDWHKRPETEKTAIVETLIDPERDDDEAEEQLVKKYGFTADEADALLSIDFPAGYLRLSRKAIDKLLPHMERGLVYMDDDESNSAMHAAGYVRRDQLQRRIFDELPDPARVHDSPIGDIPNPVVRRALVELRKLVNAILREQRRKRSDRKWRPDAIHIEMARDVKQGERARREYNMKLREREAMRDAAAQKLRENRIKVTRDAINRYLLWQEQEHICVYSGEPISFAQLFGGEVDVDHILPYSRCLDDSLMNKVVCFRKPRNGLGNHEKGQRTPYEWLSDGQPAVYDAVCQRARKLPWPKYRRFIQKELELDKFIARQLVDTSYIARATAEYLCCLVDHRHDVLGLKGQLTAELRHQWGLNDILNQESSDVKSRDDHRHHAIDAVVVALTDQSRLQQLTRIRKAGGVRETGEALDAPWEGFRDELAEKVRRVNVSHRVQRKVAGPLHEDTLYGPVHQENGQRIEGAFVVRKPLANLSPNEIDLIRDERVREAVKRRLAEHGIEIGRGKRATPAVWAKAIGDPNNPVRLPPSAKRLREQPDALGTPIVRVRVLRNEQTIQAIRGNGHTAYVKPGSVHHLSLFEYQENGKTKREAIFTSMLDATDRLKRQQQRLAEARRRIEKQTGEKLAPRDPRLGREMRRIARELPLITRTHPTRPDARFLFSLSRGELVLAEVDGREELLVFNTAASTSQQMWFFHHADARPRAKRKVYSFMPNTLKARKVTVDYLGRIRWAND